MRNKLTKFFILFLVVIPLASSGQYADTLVIRGYRVFTADTLIARFTPLDKMADSENGYERKQIAIVFDQKQYLLRHGIKTNTALSQRYPSSQWELLAFYRNETGKIKGTDSFDPIQIHRAELRKRYKIIGGSALILTGLLGISAQFISQPSPQNYSQALGQGIGGAALPVIGSVSLISGIVIIANSNNH